MKIKRKKNADTNGAPSEEQPKTPVQEYPAPDGYEERTSDLVGFWDYELGPIHFIPMHAKAFDSHIEALKPSIIIVGHAVGPQKLKDADDNAIECESNDLIGVWYKPGMIRLKDLAGLRVFMYYSGEQDTGKVNPMKTFKVMTKEPKGQTLYLQDDYRKKSKRVAIPFEVKGGRSPRLEDDDENFGDGASRSRSRARTGEPSDNSGDIDY